MLPEKISDNTISLTPSAIQAIKDILEDRELVGYALRVYISGGGCSGFQYGIALDNNIRDKDFVYEADGVKAIIDEVSIQYMNGTTIDFINDERGSGFKIDNPNNLSNFGCGGNSSGCSGCS